MIITGARQILESFPAGDIEPLNLPSHYAKNLSGYIVISSFKHSGVFDGIGGLRVCPHGQRISFYADT